MSGRSARDIHSARRALRAWTALSLSIVGGVLTLLLYFSYQRYLETASAISQSLSQGIETFLHNHFHAIDLALQSGAAEFQRLHRNGRFQDDTFSDYLKGLRQRLPDAASVRGATADGRVIYGEGIDPASIQINTDREHFKRARDQRTLIISPPVVSRITGELLMVVARPVFLPNGEFGGVIHVNTSVAHLSRVFAASRLGEHGTIALIDAERRLLIRYPEPPSAIPGQTIRLAAVQSRAAIEKGVKQTSFRSQSGVDGYWRSATFRQVGNYPVYLIVGLADTDLLSPWYRECLLAASIFGVMCALSFAFGRNIRERWRVEMQVDGMQRTQDAHDRVQALLAAIPDAIFELDHQGRCLAAPATRGPSPFPAGSQVEGSRLQDALPSSSAAELEQALRTAQAEGLALGTQLAIDDGGTQRWFELSVARKGPPGMDDASFIVAARDITERKQSHVHMEELAYSDLLTRLPNRRMFIERLHQSLAASQRSGQYGALLFLDLDHFKAVNDTLGHQYGDLLLVQTAQRLRHCVREEDVVARLGGDEFVVVLERLVGTHEDAADQALHVANKVVRELAGEYDLDGRPFASTVSVGVTLFHGSEVGVETLLKRADASMYQAKGAGRNAVRFFDPATQAATEARNALEAALRHALVNEEFLLCYQPQVDHNGRCIGAEALIRWNSPSLGMISPAQFIPLAEESGLISPIGHWVMAEACRCLAAWRESPDKRELTLAVNVSARQFAHPTFVTEVCELIEHHGIDPSRLKLELTESLLIANLDAVIERMQRLARFGIHLALDDFGTGFSSMSYLKRLPLSQIKIDRSFTDDIINDHYDTAICEAVITLCRTMELEVIAEGIETQAQWDFLLRLGCRLGQGYLFGRPMPAPDFDAWLRAREPQRASS